MKEAPTFTGRNLLIVCSLYNALCYSDLYGRQRLELTDEAWPTRHTTTAQLSKQQLGFDAFNGNKIGILCTSILKMTQMKSNFVS